MVATVHCGIHWGGNEVLTDTTSVDYVVWVHKEKEKNSYMSQANNTIHCFFERLLFLAVGFSENE